MADIYASYPFIGSGSGGGVTSLNALTGAVVLAAGANVTLTPSGNTITISSTAPGTGTVTTLSVVSANGLAGTVANATTTPAITLSTTVTGILQGNGTAISAASTTGSGAVVLANTPTLITPVIGAATGTSLQLSGLTASYAVVTDASKNLVSLLYTSVNTGSSIASRDSNGNTSFNNYIATSVTTASAGQTITMSAGSARNQICTGSSGIKFQLPDATTLIRNWVFEFNNNGTVAITVYDNGGSNLICSVPGGGFSYVFCTNNGSVNGTWDFHPLLANGSTSGTSGTSFPGQLSGNQLVSVVSTGTAPIVVASTTQVANLNAATSGIASNLSGGLGGQIPYQSAVNTTAMLANGTAGQVLTSSGTTLAPVWSTPSAAVSYFPYTTTATTGGTTTLTSASTYLQYFTGVLTHTVVMPVTSTLVLGQEFVVDNMSTSAIVINSSGGNQIVANFQQYQRITLTCTSLSGTTAASWAWATQSYNAPAGTVLLGGVGSGVGNQFSSTVGLGLNSSTTGILKLLSQGATGYVGLTVDTNAFTPYTLQLPNTAPTANQFMAVSSISLGVATCVWNNALSNPMTTLGDTIYGGASGAETRLAGNTTATREFLTSAGVSSLATAPIWSALVSGDIPDNAANTSGSAGSVSGTNVITNSNLAQMPTLTIKGNNTGGTANAADLTVAQVNLILPVFTSALNGLAPLSGGGTANYLRADGTWSAPPGTLGTGFFYLATSTSAYGGTNSTLSFTGVDNTVVGVSAGNTLTSGTDNTLYGFNAGIGITSGARNTLIGSKLSTSLITGSDNILIGYEVDSTNQITTAANIVAIGNSMTFGAINLSRGSVALGNSITCQSINSIVIGLSSAVSSSSSNSIAIGNSAYSYSTYGIAIGSSAQIASSAATNGIAIGQNSNVNTANGIAIGFGSGNASASGADLTTIGYNAGTALTSGADNTFLGYQAGQAATSGSQNTYIGSKAGLAATTVSNTTAIGYGAVAGASNSMVFGNSSVTSNLFTGNLVLNGTSSGAITIATQTAAGTFNFNLPITAGTAGQVLTSQGGSSSAMTWTTPSSSSGTVTTVSIVSANGFAGSVANASTTPAITISTSITGLLKGNGTAISAATSGTDYSLGTSALATGILKSTTSTGALTIAVAGDFPTLNQNTSGSAASLSATLIVGQGGTGNTTFTAYGVICAGTTSTSAFQNVSGLGTSGQVLTSNGASALPTWQAGGGGGNGFAYLATNSSVYGGTNSTLSFTGVRSTVISPLAGTALTTGTDNTLEGYAAGYALTTGNYNTVFGSQAGDHMVTDSNNTFIGYQAGKYQNGANDNTFIGWNAGAVVSTGNNNTFTGSSAGIALTTGHDNTFLGYNSGLVETTGNYNTILGSQAGVSITTQSNNTLIGYQAGNALTASSNTMIGYQAGSTVTTGTNNVFIGSGVSGTTNVSRNVVIGVAAVGPSSGGDSVVIGYSASADTTSVAIGRGANASGGGNNIAIGHSSGATGSGGICIGNNAQDGGGRYNILIGQANNAAFGRDAVCGFGITTDQQFPSNGDTFTASNQITFGTSGTNAVALTDMYIGRGARGDATAPSCSIRPTATAGSNITGGDFTILSGNGTGTGGSGNIIFQTAPARASGSSVCTLATVLNLAPTGIVTIGAASTTPTHAINGLTSAGGSTTALFTNVPTGATSPTGYLEVTINGTLSYIPYFQ